LCQVRSEHSCPDPIAEFVCLKIRPLVRLH
jgi:hypothetical protein